MGIRPDQEVDVAKRARVIEWLKAEMAEHVARFFKSVWEMNGQKILDSLASLIVSSYIMGRRLGIPYHQLDEAIKEKLEQHRKEGHQLEDWYQDISSLEDHLRKR